jgi:hypothetical protein
MTPIRTEDDLRSLFAEDAQDVCSSAAMLSRVTAARRRRGRRWLPALAACAAVVVVAGIVVALTQGGSSNRPRPSVGTAVPADWHTVGYPAWNMTLLAPPEWRSYQYQIPSHASTLIAYLSRATLRNPCARTTTLLDCGLPIGHLAPDDSLVGWWLYGLPTPAGISGLRGGERTVVDGRAAYIVTSNSDSCANLGGKTSIEASIGATADPGSRVVYLMQACLGPDADQSDVLTMLRSVRFAAHPPPMTIHGRLLAVGGPAPGAPRPLPGTVTLSTTDSEITVLVDNDGRYSAEVSPGTYEVVGHSPQYGSGTYLCRAAGPVTATADETVDTNVVCQER